MSHKLIIAITGASGAIYGIRLLQILKDLAIESHLIISPSARLTIKSETDWSITDITALASYNYHPSEIGAAIASGSFLTSGMIVAPCSMKTLAAIACGFEDNLIIRAANVILKEQRKLILVPRETPLSPIHLENMLKLSRLGVAICPTVPAFYHRPTSIEEIINHTIARILDLLNINSGSLSHRWGGLK